MKYGMVIGQKKVINNFNMPREGQRYAPPDAVAQERLAEQARLLEDIDGGSGREIAGLESKSERFSRLEIDRDYNMVQENPNVHSEQPIENFFVFVNPSGGTETRIVHAPHWRTIAHGDVRTTVTLRSRESGSRKLVAREEPFYTVDTKGAGYLKPSVKGGKTLDEYDDTWVKWDETSGRNKVLGLSTRDEFYDAQENIIKKSDFLAQAGLRTEVYWGFASLKCLYYKGQLTPIEELREKGIILKSKEYRPYIAVRLLKMKGRIEEAREAESRRMDLFREAFATFNRENEDKNLGLPSLDVERADDQKIFFHKFFYRMGTNLAALLNTGYCLFFLHASNVTLAAEIVDIGAASHWKSSRENENIAKEYTGIRRGHLKDMRDAVYALKKLRAAAKLAGLKTGNAEDLKTAFMDGFDSHLNAEQAQKQKTDPNNARKWMDAIVQAIIVDGKKLSALLHDEDGTIIEKEWGIAIE